MGATDGVEVEIDSPDAQQNSKVLFEARVRIENPVAEEKDYVKGQETNKKSTFCAGKQEKPTQTEQKSKESPLKKS